ncbi:protein spaetzle 3 isoform X1 [Anopheles stephensi]|uniref:protein spaetzle 3 isoform X1 n=2 Tax=Anopheles stephensi TaxID=30069 RepID=UPI0016588FEF|nr:protein spaetzle 3 isoform X1 [Anopheles stephensi]XP_035917646.1 protein spaetzle 3 isoform X1 [Anopheles stephensi]XP_035917647.1 protein spaetzle 3 isoform X1 [Anopheles stephensi]XP_035917648.1 protein spaetzle 3 isoform X1 [Anopheles stephensi]XP_035917649.1 protein spaetzle 3 isoform X1 [Anopheles stephensi]
MALVNYTLPFGNIQPPTWATASPLQNQHASAVNNLLYGPAGHQGDDQDFYKNAPYAPPQRQSKQSPQQQQQQHSIQYRQTPRNNYLPPPSYIPPSAAYPQAPTPPPQQTQQPLGRTYGEGSYADGAGSPPNPAGVPQQPQQQPPAQQPAYYEYSSGSYATQPGRPFTEQHANPQTGTSYRSNPPQPAGPRTAGSQGSATGSYPQRPPVYASVGSTGTRTSIHPVLDYDEEDDDDYYDEAVEVTPIVGISDNRKNSRMPTVTPIQGPIFIKNGTVPVVPLFAYPQVSNGTFIQIPIWWTALSVALGLSIHGDVIRGVPCIKKYHQLFCPTAGNTYPSDKIEMFIDENKALMKRMYGDFEMASRFPSSPGRKRKRSAPGPDPYGEDDEFTLLPELMDLYGEPGGEVRLGGDSYFSKLRKKRQNQNTSSRGGASGGGRGGGSSGGSTNARQTATPANGNGAGSTSGESNTGRVDACESKIEIVTPYWATNSAGKVRAIVNTQHFEQAIHQEVCSKTQTNRCSGDCGCEQKYKWHRLLAYDPDNDCKGIFMDWFLFPSCCVCRCNP